MSDQGFAHIAFLTDHDGLDAALQQAEQRRLFLRHPAQSRRLRDGRLAFFRDDSAITYELIQREEHIRKAPFSTELVRAFRYVTVSIKPEFLQKTDAFYTQELSFQREGEGLYAFGTDHVQVVPGEGRIESITLDVYSLEKARAALEQLGLAVQPAGQGLCATRVRRRKDAAARKLNRPRRPNKECPAAMHASGAFSFSVLYASNCALYSFA